MARVSLMSAAPAATPRMNPGRRNCTRWPAGSWANSTYSETGRQPHQIAGRTMTSVASQKPGTDSRSEEHTSELQSRLHLVCRLLLEKKKKQIVHDCADAVEVS